jgi:hypothetical protein
MYISLSLACYMLPNLIFCVMIYDMIYLTVIGFTPDGSGTVHIYTQYTGYRDGTYITIKKLTNLGSGGRAPSLTSYILAFALQLRKKHGKTSVRVASRTSQTDTVQYTKNEQYKTQKKNSNTVQCQRTIKNTELHNREKSSYQVSKPCVTLKL